MQEKHKKIKEIGQYKHLLMKVSDRDRNVKVKNINFGGCVEVIVSIVTQNSYDNFPSYPPHNQVP